MRTDGQTSKHLLLAVVVTMVGMMLMLITVAFSWEEWMLPVILIGNGLVWFLHIGRVGSETLYENLCVGLLLVGFFFFGVHSVSLFDIPAIACMVFLIFSMIDKTLPLYMTVGLYVMVLLYHCLVLHTITRSISVQDVIRLFLGAIIVAGAMAIARYRINQRMEERARYQYTLSQLSTVEQQNAEFLSNVSHELRTPVNMVLGISEVALGKGQLSPEIRGDIQSIQSAGKRLSSQINKILDYTEIVEGTLTASKAPYTVPSVLNDVITTIAVQGNTNHLELVFDIDPNLPSVLIGDAGKISHVLKILLENSLKFTEEGGINICVEYRKESYGINLIMDVSDTGIGMTDAQISKIYDDFYQADSGSARFTGGLGLGIPIARGLLHSMGGFLHFESRETQGLHARVTIPQTIADDTPAMLVTNPEQICVACYFKPERYTCDEVKLYYDRLISHLIGGLGIEGYQAHNFEGFLKLMDSHKLTHVFIAQNEYEENGSYYEELAASIQVTVVAERGFELPADSSLLAVHKPFFAISIVNILNGDLREQQYDENYANGRRPFYCEDVHVLVVDDEEMNLVVAKGFLDSYGIQTDTCLSGKEAVKRCTQVSYDIIFLDHMMPGFDGVETLRRIREINNGAYQDLPVVALTANTISGAREMFRDEGFTEFVAKPIERTVLERVLRRILPKRCIRYSSDDSQPENPQPAAGPPPAAPVQAAPQTASQAAAAPPVSPFAALEAAGIDVQLGLDYCCGDDAFYRDMLRMFSSQREQKSREIAALYDEADWVEYAVKVHALKSTSLTIGAKELSEQARLLEQAGKDEDIEYLRANQPRLMALYQAVCETISGV